MEGDRTGPFLCDLESRLSIIEKALASLEQNPHDASAMQQLRAELHNIKGTGTPFGVPEATALARELEEYLSSADHLTARLLAVVRNRVVAFHRILDTRRA